MKGDEKLKYKFIHFIVKLLNCDELIDCDVYSDTVPYKYKADTHRRIELFKALDLLSAPNAYEKYFKKYQTRILNPKDFNRIANEAYKHCEEKVK